MYEDGSHEAGANPIRKKKKKNDEHNLMKRYRLPLLEKRFDDDDDDDYIQADGATCLFTFHYYSNANQFDEHEPI